MSVKQPALELRRRELRIAIDDGGAGYSSMSQLPGLASDELKIDKSFVVELNTDRRGRAIVRSAIEVARALELTGAEGIERDETLQSLPRMGSEIGQGNAISYPLTSRALGEYLCNPECVCRLLPDILQAIPLPVREFTPAASPRARVATGLHSLVLEPNGSPTGDNSHGLG